jgi:putative membrane protein
MKMMTPYQSQNIPILQQRGFPLLLGATAGFLGTIPMTIFMLAMHRFLPKWQQYALPPQEITDELADRANLKKHMDKKERLGAALASHFGYGATMGAIYSLISKRIPLPYLLKGMLFGLVVWVASYLGLLPSLRISQSADEEPVRRNLLMIAAHIVWGSTTGIVAALLGL